MCLFGFYLRLLLSAWRACSVCSFCFFFPVFFFFFFRSSGSAKMPSEMGASGVKRKRRGRVLSALRLLGLYHHLGALRCASIVKHWVQLSDASSLKRRTELNFFVFVFILIARREKAKKEEKKEREREREKEGGGNDRERKNR